MRELQTAWLAVAAALGVAIVASMVARYYYHSACKAWACYEKLHQAHLRLQRQTTLWHTTVDAEEILPSQY